jgi:predicted DCC family thiol-disulfide oxidoreductase YuxK
MGKVGTLPRRQNNSPMFKAFSYHTDPSVPGWDETRNLIVFDGECIFCSGFIRFVLRHDKIARFNFTMAQSELGQSLYRHYRLSTTDFETNLVISEGQLYEKLNAFTKVMFELGWPWRSFIILRTLPVPIADWLYDRIAKNRYRIFGRYEKCMVPSVALRARIIE